MRTKDDVLFTALGAKEYTHDWIVDSGATSHICNSIDLFEEFNPLSKSNMEIAELLRQLVVEKYS